MDLVFLKLVLLVNSWLFARGSPVAMLQHATSSQSIVFHPGPPTTSPPVAAPSGADQYSATQPKYEYKYEVSDHQTGDRKSHWESRDGDRVRGVYTLYEPDGALRTVEYSADAVHGFNAIVRRNEPNRPQHQHQHPRVETPSYNPQTSSRDGYRAAPSRSGYIPERGYPNPGHRNDNPTYPGAGGSFNSAVGFSVKHIMELNKDSQSKPF